MKSILRIALFTLSGLFAVCAFGQTPYDSTSVRVNSGDPQSAVFTFNDNLIQVQFRCGANVWWYYARPNTSTNFIAYGPFSMQLDANGNGCQATYSTEGYGNQTNDILTEVVNAPLTAQVANGQTVTVVFANFTSDKDGCGRGSSCYYAIGGNSRITVQ